MSELEDAVELMKNYILATPEHEKALNLLIEVAESPQKYCPFSFNCIPAVWKKKIKEIIFSFLQKVREECKKYYNFDDHYTDCKKCCYKRDCIFQSLDAESDKTLTAFIDKVLEEK